MRNIILESDWCSDCDDAVALRIISRAHKNHRINLKCILLNTVVEHSVPSLDGFLSLEGIKDISIGIDHDAKDFNVSPLYQKALYPHAVKYKSNNDAEDAVTLYRKILSSSDEPLEIIEIGFLQNIANLLESRGDEISPKPGLELVKEKVKKIWVMAGKWDEPGGVETNFSASQRARVAAEKFCRLCPVPVTFLGWEVAHDVITGSKLKKDDFLYKILCDHGSPNGRMSWDPMLVQLALTGDEKLAGFTSVCGTASVNSQTGQNFFKSHVEGLHKYVIKDFQNNYYEKIIDEIID